MTCINGPFALGRFGTQTLRSQTPPPHTASSRMGHERARAPSGRRRAVWVTLRAAEPDTALPGDGPGEPEPEPEPHTQPPPSSTGLPMHSLVARLQRHPRAHCVPICASHPRHRPPPPCGRNAPRAPGANQPTPRPRKAAAAQGPAQGQPGPPCPSPPEPQPAPLVHRLRRGSADRHARPQPPRPGPRGLRQPPAPVPCAPGRRAGPRLLAVPGPRPRPGPSPAPQHRAEPHPAHADGQQPRPQCGPDVLLLSVSRPRRRTALPTSTVPSGTTEQSADSRKYPPAHLPSLCRVALRPSLPPVGPGRGTDVVQWSTCALRHLFHS